MDARLTVHVDVTALERAIADAHAALDALEQRAARLSGELPAGVLLLGAALVESTPPRRYSRRSLLGLKWWLGE